MSITVIAIAAGLLVAGCGDDDEETTTSTTTTSGGTGASGATGASGSGLLPADFVEQADAICKGGDAALQKSFQSLGQNPSPSEIETVVTDEVVPNIRGQIEAIRALDPPSEGAEELETFLADADAVLDDIEDDPSLIEQDPFADVNELGDELGLQECGD